MIRLLHLKVNIRRLITVPGRYYASDYFFISTPIFYVNGAPHIGHMQSCVYADALARVHSLLGKRVVFSTGTDEHGLKVQQASEAAKKLPLEYCTEMSSKFKKIFTEGDIAFTHFVRTTDENHKEIVQSFWRKLKANGHITKGRYEGWYSVVEESFVPASQVKELKEGSKITMVSSETGSPVEKMLEENYVFPLSKFENDILHWLSQDAVNPVIFVEDLKRWIGEGLADLSISRPRSRLSWGIPVPEDESQIIYVWLDALVNYLTVAHCNEKDIIWPADCHVIGKDILKFHAIYWPAFLIAAGYEP
ncbi:Methionine--tRNA ligase, mitochondrial, partial [Stegodyphus mimosarum]